MTDFQAVQKDQPVIPSTPESSPLNASSFLPLSTINNHHSLLLNFFGSSKGYQLEKGQELQIVSKDGPEINLLVADLDTHALLTCQGPNGTRFITAASYLRSLLDVAVHGKAFDAPSPNPDRICQEDLQVNEEPFVKIVLQAEGQPIFVLLPGQKEPFIGIAFEEIRDGCLHFELSSHRNTTNESLNF